MIRRGGGAIVTIGSVDAFYPDPGVLSTTAPSRPRSPTLPRPCRRSSAPRVFARNSISPGPVLTDLWLGEGGVAEVIGKASGASPQEVADGAVFGTPTGRFTTPDEVADLTLFLASDRAANIAGADMTIDGGFITTV
ncbi:SDR family oxidoreductase [Rhodococcus tukisamuensis]|nr:SDR family oxidoreductase [Rhodococcus tukisamuensis]